MNDQDGIEPTSLLPEPMPMAQKPGLGPVVQGLGWVAAVGGAFLMLVSLTVGRCRGATRSTQLKWEQRQAEIQQAVQDSAIEEAATAAAATGDDPASEPGQ